MREHCTPKRRACTEFHDPNSEDEELNTCGVKCSHRALPFIGTFHDPSYVYSFAMSPLRLSLQKFNQYYEINN